MSTIKQHSSSTLAAVFTISLSLLLAPGCSDDTSAGNDSTVPAQDSGAGLESSADLAPDSGPMADPQLKKLASWMTGSFSSEKQSLKDASYYHITLAMKRIWPALNPGQEYWLYVEQAVSGSNPYRQRIYRLKKVADIFESRVYEFSSATEMNKAVGAWKQAKPLAHLSPKDLVEKAGCTVLMKRDAGGAFYKGSTDAKKCLTTYNGATYTTSQVTVTAQALSSWDQGFDSSDKQVWGAVVGPYVFDKLQDLDKDLAN